MTLYHINGMLLNCIKKSIDFSYELGGMLKLSHELFRSKWQVAIREYYIDDKGESQPGKYGISIDSAVWRRFSRKSIQDICEYISI